MLFATAACAPAPPAYEAATSHYTLEPRKYAVDVELGRSDDLASARVYIARRATELCSDGYDVVTGEALDYQEHYPASDETCRQRPRHAGEVCFGGGHGYGEPSHFVHAVVVCRWHGL